MPHLTRSAYNWEISLYIIRKFHFLQQNFLMNYILCLTLWVLAARPGFKKAGSCSSSEKSYLEAIPLTSEGMLPHDYVLEDPDSHFIYICNKKDEEVAHLPSYPLMENVLYWLMMYVDAKTMQNCACVCLLDPHIDHRSIVVLYVSCDLSELIGPSRNCSINS